MPLVMQNEHPVKGRVPDIGIDSYFVEICQLSLAIFGGV
jgi:hypothetical protein